MLVLSRRVDESIAVGDSIVITILAIEGDRVKLGVSAPRDIPIRRQEVYVAIQEQDKLHDLLTNNPAPQGFEELRQMLAGEEEIPDEPDPKDTPE
jgi:carbon storage regulator